MNNQTVRRTGLMEKSLLPNLFDFNWEKGIGCGGERECVGGAALTLFPSLTPPALSQGTMEHRREWDALPLHALNHPYYSIFLSLPQLKCKQIWWPNFLHFICFSYCFRIHCYSLELSAVIITLKYMKRHSLKNAAWMIVDCWSVYI